LHLARFIGQVQGRAYLGIGGTDPVQSLLRGNFAILGAADEVEG
jgi:hypothetical protein